ncbi:MAG: hypothetical protein AB4352_15480 [Hormoscilla sp.]
MSTTIQQIARYLDNRHWNYELLDDSNDSRIITGVKAENVDQFLILIHLTEEGEYLELTAPDLLQAKNHIHKEKLFQTMLTISWQSKMLRWEYNPIDGEVGASIAFPLEDASLTERQFDRSLGTLIKVVDEVAMPRLQAVLETGSDPGEEQLGEWLLLSLEEALPDGSLSLLEQALEARKYRGVA